MDILIKFGKIKNWGIMIGGSLFIAAPITAMAAQLPSVTAQNGCADWIAKVVSTEGRVETRLTAETAWQTVTLNQTLCPGSMVHTQAHSRAALLLRNNTLLRLTQKSTLTLPAAQPDKPFWLELLDGAINVITRTPKKFQVDTPFVNAAVDGTEFFVKIARAPLPEGGGLNSGQTTVSVFEGRVIAENATGRVTLRGGEAATASVGQAPVTSIPVNPGEQRQAVHWALHYPPILSYRAADFKEGNETSWQARVRKSIEYTQVGDLQNALASVIDTPQDATTAFFSYRASLLLNVGRVNEANADIKTALNIAPNDGIALALQSVIAVAQNQHETALTLAKQSTAQAPQVAGSWMALSYAQQATNNLPEAINAAQHGADNEPDNALAWAHIAELHLMTGNLNDALAAASKAMALNPNLARTQSVLGFVYLTQIKTTHARQAFEQAIMLDQADPLPRLGLGLAKIRDGDLAAGREDIEIATALDPNNALVRSYMGKAYYEEKRDPLAATQFDIAKTLDPKDPTPWFYDAILKQSTNRPVEALQDLQKSIELNDNRAVYRSRLLLDQDQAARSASQARIYSDLGFQQLALVESWKSLAVDPTNYSAHRFLADSYTALSRHEVARVSEVLQAQLLQPIHARPVNPSAAETSLFVLEGAGANRAAFNEFTPLFSKDRVALQANLNGGTNNTWSDEAVLFGNYRNVAASLGQLHYTTNGYRPNNDFDQNIYNAFIQYDLSNATSAQLEWRRRDIEGGDVDQRFGETNFDPLLRQAFDEESARLGFRHAFTPRHTLLGSAIYSRKDRHDASSPDDFTARTEGYHAELQSIMQLKSSTLIVGAGQANQRTNTLLQFDFLGFIIPIEDSRSNRRDNNLYVYNTFTPLTQLHLTLGLSYDRLSNDNNDEATGLATNEHRNQFDPKLGLLWSPTPQTTVRLAAFRTLRRLTHANQTIEPTQIGGFNQFFDDIIGTKAKRYGLGIDHQFSSGLFVGTELSRRDSDRPLVDPGLGTVTVEANKEALHRVYLYRILNSRWNIATEYFFGRTTRDFTAGRADARNPIEITTRYLPISLNYHQPRGFFGKTAVNLVAQDVGFSTQQGVANDQAHFATVDLTAGYRLAGRKTIVSVTAQNIFDRQFKFHDTSLSTETSTPLLARFRPERSIFATVAFWF